jgi:hypothetical protein
MGTQVLDADRQTTTKESTDKTTKAIDIDRVLDLKMAELVMFVNLQSLIVKIYKRSPVDRLVLNPINY